MSDNAEIVVAVSALTAVSVTVLSHFIEYDLTQAGFVFLLFAIFAMLVGNMMSNILDVFKGKSSPEKKGVFLQASFRLDQNRIMMLPVINDNKEAVCELTNNGTWEKSEGVILTREDYTEMFPEEVHWDDAAPALVDDLTRVARESRIGDDVQILLSAVAYARENASREDYRMILLALDDAMDHQQNRDVFLP